MSDAQPSSLPDEDFYYDGHFLVFTAAYLRKRGTCCGNDCRHCPYDAAGNIVPRQGRVASTARQAPMQTLLKYARIFFALDLIGFGVQLFLTGHFAAGLPPVPPVVHAAPLVVHLFALVLITFAAGLLWKRSVATCALSLGLVYTGSALVLHAHAAGALVRDGSMRSSFLEALAIGAALLVLFAIEVRPPRALSEAPVALGWIGLVLFAISIAVFGEQHFEYAAFVATLIPGWIPQHLFWARFTGACMLAAAVGFFFPRRAALAGILLGTMFLLWFLLLHLPRIVAAPHNRDEWTSGLVALAMADASWIVAAGRSIRRGKTY